MKTQTIWLVLAIAVVSIVVAVGVYALISSQARIHSIGTLKAVGVEVYWDSDLTQPVTEIQWGLLEPGQNKTIGLFLKSTANVPSTITLSTGNWTPSEATNYIGLEWNYDGSVLNPDDVIPVDLTLVTSPYTTGIKDFTFDIIITAVG